MTKMTNVFKIKEDVKSIFDKEQGDASADAWLRKQGQDRAAAKRSSDADYASRGDSRNNRDDNWKYRSNY